MSRRPAIAFILVTLLIDVMGFGLLLPVLPALVGEFTASRDAQTYWYGAMIVTFTARFHGRSLISITSFKYRHPVTAHFTRLMATLSEGAEAEESCRVRGALSNSKRTLLRRPGQPLTSENSIDGR